MDRPPDFAVGEVLRRARRVAQLSQRELAAKANVPESTLARIESSAAPNPSLRTALALLAAADCYLTVHTSDTAELPPHPDEAERDQAGRHYPAHLDLVPTNEPYWPKQSDWWGWYRSWAWQPGARIPAKTFNQRGSLPFSRWRWEQKQTSERALVRAGLRDAGAHGTLLPVGKVGVLALQGDVREHARMLESVGAHAVPVRREVELADLDGLVIPGGESTTIIRLAQTFELMEPLREFIASGRPVYGSCAGLILLADRVDGGGDPLEATFGGIDMTVRRNAFGRQVDSFEEDVNVEGIDGGPFRAVFIRAPWVEQIGHKAWPLGRVSTGAATGRVVAVRQGNLLATSFHPELTGDRRVHAYFCEMVRKSR